MWCSSLAAGFILCSEGEYIELNPGQIERSGEGTHQFADGMTYTGQWVKDRMSGRGNHILSCGQDYHHGLS